MCNSSYETQDFACFVVSSLFEYNQQNRLYMCWKVCDHVGGRESARIFTVWMHLVEWFGRNGRRSCVFWVVQLFIAKAIFIWSSSDCIAEDTPESVKSKTNSSCIILRLRRVHQRCTRTESSPSTNKFVPIWTMTLLDRLMELDTLCCIKRLKKNGSWWVWDVYCWQIYGRMIYTSQAFFNRLT